MDGSLHRRTVRFFRNAIHLIREMLECLAIENRFKFYGAIDPFLPKRMNTHILVILFNSLCVLSGLLVLVESIDLLKTYAHLRALILFHICTYTFFFFLSLAFYDFITSIETTECNRSACFCEPFQCKTVNAATAAAAVGNVVWNQSRCAVPEP